MTRRTMKPKTRRQEALEEVMACLNQIKTSNKIQLARCEDAWMEAEIKAVTRARAIAAGWVRWLIGQEGEK